MSAEENNCFICWESLNKKKFGKKKVIHKDDTWEHSCHEKCLNSWNKRCITVEKVYPKCPACNSFQIPIKKIHNSIRNQAEQILEEEAEEEVIEEILPNYVIVANHRLNNIINRDNRFKLAPFLGLMICINGYTVVKHTNSDYYNLNIHTTIQQLKNCILARQLSFLKRLSIFNRINLMHNLNYKNWINWTYPTFRISNIHYAIPPYTSYFDHLDSSFDLNNPNVANNLTLADIYLDYQTKVGDLLQDDTNMVFINSSTKPFAFNNLKNIYFKKSIGWSRITGPDDYGYEIKAYVNPENPYIASNYSHEINNYADNPTYDSLSWLVVNLEVVE